MRISDWISDVCSSDLVLLLFHLASALMAGRSAPPLYMILLGALLYQIPDLTGYSGKVGELVCHFFLFYALGVYFGPHLRRLNEDLERRAIAVVAAILLAGAVTFSLSRGLDYWSAAALPAAISGTVLVLVLSVRVGGVLANGLEYRGQRAMAIYVLHVM